MKTDFQRLVVIVFFATLTATGCSEFRNAEKLVQDLAKSGSKCSVCHGGDQNAAPPRDSKGRTSTSLLSVGAHQQHLNPELGQPLSCSECHSVPERVEDAGHMTGERAQVKLGPLSRRGGVSPKYDPATGSCVTYCHGESYPAGLGGSAKRPVWNKVDGSQKTCASCHGSPPQNYPENMGHYDGVDCGVCHPGYGPSTVDKQKHLNGAIDYEQNCLACHGAGELCALGIRQYCSR